MRSLGWVGLVCLGLSCSGKNDSGDTAGDDDDDTTPISCDLPTFNLDSLTCGQLGGAFLDVVSAGDGCNAATDCQAFRANCENWNEVGCYYAVNSACVVQDGTLSEYNSAAATKGCSSTQICDCNGPVPEVDCVSHTCQLIDVTFR